VKAINVIVDTLEIGAFKPVALSYPTPQAQFAALNQAIPDESDFALVKKHAPRIRLDAREPFMPLAVGYTLFRNNGRSPSFPREIILPESAASVIEYAVWWDWDIERLYGMQHIWVYLDRNNDPVAAEASWHEGWQVMKDADGNVPLEDERITLFSEAGKHTFAPISDWLLTRKSTTDRACDRNSGRMGVLVPPLFDGIIRSRTPLHNNLVHAYLERHAFTPSFEFSRQVDLASSALVSWMHLFQWIPGRVAWWCDYLRETIPPYERRPLRIAHRGASAYAQEGSRSSIEKAAELGADMVEIDIRSTADDVPVIAHDPNLQRVFGVEGMIGEMTLEALRAATPPGRQPILTFEEMIALCSGLDMSLYLDIKEVSVPAMTQVIANLQSHNMLPYAIFGSFRPDVVADIKAAAPDAPTSILFSSVHVDPVALAASVKADYVHPCWERFESPSTLLNGEWMNHVREAGLGVICWHEERPLEIAALHALGVDGICSDRPELLRVPCR
jgi:glycerophosphoryl diester phosphodiesterase